MIFSFLPPEVNSTLMYTGPGSGPLAAAAAGWQGLANDLQTTATSFKTIVTNLASGSWTGPSSQLMVAAVEPYVAWLTETSAQAAQTAAQAVAAVNAYEAAYSATVPPALVFTNRAQLLTLIATNFFGQNTPAIAANEAQYAEMWVQDATAMNTYAVASTQTTALPQMAAPAAATNGSAQVVQSAAAAHSASVTGSVISGITSVLDPLLTDVGLGAYTGDVTSAITGALSGSGLSSASIEPIYLTMMGAYYGSMMASMPARMFMSMGSTAARGAAGVAGMGGETLLNSVASLVDGKMQAIVGSVASQLQNWGSSVSAQLGRATALGGLSVPHAWSEAATGAITRAAPVLPNTSVPAPAASAMPGGPFGHALLGAMSGRGLASLAAKAPKVVPKSPAAG
ncbi:PPE family protein [Mycobacterium sp.]|uniref:PPE family protein n=1 Tax=Mycobacterium sp. TaxID=1785 RepID=UPI0012850FC0|nr:PPE family protein [Mycobacterium sp.]KAA8963537.1 MAG: PPE family protein [Mycobacterium sp.]